MSVSAQASSRWVSRYRTLSQPVGLRAKRLQHVVGAHAAEHLSVTVDGDTQTRR